MPRLTFEEISHKIAGKLIIQSEISIIDNINDLSLATKNQVSFLSQKNYLHKLASSTAGLILIDNEDFLDKEHNFILCKNASVAFSILIEHFCPPKPKYEHTIHKTAIIGNNCQMNNCHIAPYVVIEDNVTIGENVIIHSNCVIGQNTTIGNNCIIYSNSSILYNSKIGNNCIINSGCVIGSEGFGFTSDANGHHKIIHLGNVVLEDNVELGANCSIDRARFASTIIQEGTKIDNLVQIGHNAKIGKHCLIVAQSGVAGSSSLGNRVIMAGQSGVAGHVSVGDNTILMAKAGVTKSIKANEKVIGMPAINYKEFIQEKRLKKTISDLKKRIEKLENAN